MKCLYANGISSVIAFMAESVTRLFLSAWPYVVDVLPATKTTLESKLEGGAIQRAKPLSGF